MITGGHYKAKSFAKDVWAQRKIYIPLVIHFYDAATDIGVVIYWYDLYADEQDGVYDYESVDMEIFFWCGIAFLALYRIMLFGVLLFFKCDKRGADDIAWVDLLLVILHLYVFKTVYLSYKGAQEKIKKNIEAREKNKQIRANSDSQATEPNPEAGSTTIVATKEAQPPKIKEEEIDVDELQWIALLIESVTESLPQIMLQSVFIIRSYNDSELQNTEIWLLLLSVFASLLSISSKFVKWDADEGAFAYKRDFGKTPEFESISQGLCFNKPTMWYAVRVLWRVFHTAAAFSIYVLVWTVMGGAFLPIWCSVVYLLFAIVVFMDMGVDWETFLKPLANMGGLVELEWPQISIKWATNLIGLVLIAVFASTNFDCAICADASRRNFDNETESGSTNHRIAIFFVMGCVSFVMDILLLFVMECGLDIVDD